MAKKKAYDGSLNYLRRDIDWGVGDASATEGLPLAGSVVQKYIKENFDHKAGWFYTNQTVGKCYVFASQEDCSTYLSDPSTYANLVLSEFDAISKYKAVIKVSDPSTGEKVTFKKSEDPRTISFSWDVLYDDKESQDENVVCTYTFEREGYKKTFTTTYTPSQKNVVFDVADFLDTGKTTISIFIEAQTHKVSTIKSISYKIIDFDFTDVDYNISDTYSENDVFSLYYTATGYGNKKLYCFIDGVYDSANSGQLSYDSPITGHIDYNCSLLSEGTHNVIVYASILGDNDIYYFSDVLYRDFMVVHTNSALTHNLVAVQANIKSSYLNIKNTDTNRDDCYNPLKLYGLEQYISYSLKFGTHSKSGSSSVNIKLDDTLLYTGIISENNVIQEKELNIDEYGENKKFYIICSEDNTTYTINANIAKSTIIDEDKKEQYLEFNFDAAGKDNSAVDSRSVWDYKSYHADLTGFNWNSTSGWVNNGLLINNGATISFNYAPFFLIQNNGKTLEFEFETRNVSNDNTIICSLGSDEQTSPKFIIKANSASLKSTNNVLLETKFKSEERVRITFVINPSSTSKIDNNKLLFVYVNGILSGSCFYGSGSYKMSSEDKLIISGSSSAEIWLKQIRVYNAVLTNDEILNNYVKYRDIGVQKVSVYNKNNIVDKETGQITKDLILKNLKLPVMTVIGTVKEGEEEIPVLKWLDLKAPEKGSQVNCSILFENPNDVSTSFYAENVTMTPQGTSSMKYPKRNYRIYTAYNKLLQPNDFHMWYTYGKTNSEEWEEIPVKGKIDPSTGKDKRKRSYIFKTGGQKAERWTIKADFAESSGTHNTGIARLWNAAMKGARVSYTPSDYYYEKINLSGNYSYNKVSAEEVSGKTVITVSEVPSASESTPEYIKFSAPAKVNNAFVCKTNAQLCAENEEFDGDVRTTVDGYPIAMFYQETENSPLVFMGKYNFNNDKSNESVFGFTGIDSFDNGFNGYYDPTKVSDASFYDTCDKTDPNAEKFSNSMQCWELLDSADNYALYLKPVTTLGTEYRSGFEARYPDDHEDIPGSSEEEDPEKYRFSRYVKKFSDWMNNMRESAVVVREDPEDPEIFTIDASYVQRDKEYYDIHKKDKSKDEDSDTQTPWFWSDDPSAAVARLELGFTMDTSDMLTQSEVSAFPNINGKVIKYYDTKVGDYANPPFVKVGEGSNKKYYEQIISTIYNKIVSWTNSYKFETSKWKYLDVYKIAAYYVYLIRFGAVDQVVKNAMFTSEDGRHWYYINYDNDTILGVRNDGLLVFDPDIDRNYYNEPLGGYAYAGRESVLWNCLEADEEFMNQIVPAVDDALSKAGIMGYNDVIKEMNTDQCQKWCERIYNQDAKYKYVDSYNNDGQDYLSSMQGSREMHRIWWLSKRFNYYDAKFVNSNYKGNTIDLTAAASNVPTTTLKIVSGYPSYFTIGLNTSIFRKQGDDVLPIYIADGSSYTFDVNGFGKGSPLLIYSAGAIKELDLSGVGQYLSKIDFTKAKNSLIGTKLEKFILLGQTEYNNSFDDNGSISNIQILEKLKYLDLKNIKGNLSEINGLDKLKYLETFISTNSDISSITFAKGCPISSAKLSDKTSYIKFEELPNLTWSGLKFGSNDLDKEKENLYSIYISKCPGLSTNFTKIYGWYKNRKVANSQLYIDEIKWNQVNIEELKELANLKNTGSLTLKGKIIVSSKLSLSDIEYFSNIFGDCFNSNNELYITDEQSVFIKGPNSIIEGNSAQYTSIILNGIIVNNPWSLSKERDDYEINSSTGYLTSREYEYDTEDVSVRLKYKDIRGVEKTYEYPIKIEAVKYPKTSDVSILGNVVSYNESEEYELSYPAWVTGNLKYQWELSGESGYISIQGSANSKKVKLVVSSALEQMASETLSVTISNSRHDDEGGPEEIGTVSINLTFINSNVLVTPLTNEYLFKAIKELRWTTEDYFLKSEAREINDASLAELLSKIKEDGYKNKITSLKELGEFKSVEHLPNWAFSYSDSDSSLIEIILPPIITAIPTSCFYRCRNLKSVIVPKYVKTIKNSAFFWCTDLESIIFENTTNSVITIEDNAFTYSGFKNIILPDSVKSIGSEVFNSNRNLEEIIIPKSTTNISSNNFIKCAKLTSIKVAEENSVYSSKNINNEECNAILLRGSDDDRSVLVRACKNTIIPNNIKTIKSSAFSYISYDNEEKTISIPDTVETIESSAFYNNELSYIKLSSNNNFTNINNSVFYNSRLKSIEIPNNIKNIYDYAFFGTRLEDISIGSSVEYIKDTAFGNNILINTIYVNPSNTVIKDHVDGQYSNILYDTSTKMIVAVTTNRFNDIKLPSDLEIIGGYVFYGCGIEATELDFSGTHLLKICVCGCANMKYLSRVSFPATLTSLEDQAFTQDIRLSYIYMPTPDAPSLQTGSVWGSDSTAAGAQSGVENNIYVKSSAKTKYDWNTYPYWKQLFSSTGGKFILKEIAV